MPEHWEPLRRGQPISTNELNEVAEELLQHCKAFTVWLFSGEMGSGKTTLIKAICRQLGVYEGMSSPTFSIVNEYDRDGDGKIYHFDFYRLKKEQEAFDIGAEEYFDSGNYCFIEWAEKIPSLIPSRHVEIRILPADLTHRMIQYIRHD